MGPATRESSFYVTMTDDSRTRRPSFVFLIHHPVSNEYLLWDLGIRKEFELDYPHPSFAYFQTHFEEDVSDTLASIGIKASQISKVLISRTWCPEPVIVHSPLTLLDKHWDHTGNPAPYNNATFYIGAKDVSEVATLKGSERVMSVDFDTNPGQPVASFDRSYDIYRDGSVIIVDAHGHTPGHINLLVRTSAGGYMLLASDGCHHTRLLSTDPAHAHCTFGKYRAHWEDESIPPSHSFNEDVAQSETHLSRMRACEASKDIQVVIAHDEAKWKDWFGGENYGLGPELGKV